jgi:hypothetical protein
MPFFVLPVARQNHIMANRHKIKQFVTKKIGCKRRLFSVRSAKLTKNRASSAPVH